MRTLNLISLYYYVCQLYDEHLSPHCFRHTKNGIEPLFTDQELITLYLFIEFTYQPRHLKSNYMIAADTYADWFPHLPSYERYNKRLNRISSVMPLIVSDLCRIRFKDLQRRGQLHDEGWLLTDSFPVVCCAGNRSGVVAPELTDRGYNSTKNMHFWGVKVHVIGIKVPNGLPVPYKLWVAPASEHDYRAQVSELEQLAQSNLSGDKAFESKELIDQFERQGGTWMIGKKDNYRKRTQERQRHIAADNMYNRSVAKLKQPIEALFAAFHKMGVQTASLVRSTAGLTRQLMGRIAASLLGATILC